MDNTTKVMRIDSDNRVAIHVQIKETAKRRSRFRLSFDETKKYGRIQKTKKMKRRLSEKTRD